MHVLTVHGKGFLWHQIRHIVAVLVFIGRGVEPPEVISRVLDTSVPRPRPAYEIASELPLVLYECEFPDVKFVYNADVLSRVTRTTTDLYIDFGTKAFLGLTLLDQLESAAVVGPDNCLTTWGELRKTNAAPKQRPRNHMRIPK